MVAEQDLQVAREIAHTVVSAAGDRVRKVILHGSRAAGKARRTSDFDIVVVMNDPVEDWVAESMRLTDLFNVSPRHVDRYPPRNPLRSRQPTRDDALHAARDACATLDEAIDKRLRRLQEQAGTGAGPD